MTAMTTLAATYGSHAISRLSLSPARAAWMRSLLFDHLAVTVGGIERASAKAAVAAYTAGVGTTNGPASVIGSTTKVSVEDAALVNGITSHGLELDDTFEDASHHPAVVVFPAALAVGEELDASLQAVIDAAVVGYDIMCHAGVVLGPAESYARGFHPTGVTGALGAAAAVARLRGLNAEQSENAIGLAADMAAGSLEFLSDGAWTKRLNAGHAAAVGVRAARLAAAGFVAPKKSLEGRDGFLYNYGKGLIPERVTPIDAGEAAWRTSIKLYPCCRYMHGNIDLLLDWHAAHPDVKPEDIKDVEVAVITAGSRLVSVPPQAKLKVLGPVDAQFNMPYGAALAIATGSATVKQFDTASDLAPGLLPLMKKVRCVTNPKVEAAFPAAWTAAAKITLENGDVWESECEAYKGSPGARATEADLMAKAKGIVGDKTAQRLLKASAGQGSARELMAEVVASVDSAVLV